MIYVLTPLISSFLDTQLKTVWTVLLLDYAFRALRSLSTIGYHPSLLAHSSCRLQLQFRLGHPSNIWNIYTNCFHWSHGARMDMTLLVRFTIFRFLGLQSSSMIFACCTNALYELRLLTTFPPFFSSARHPLLPPTCSSLRCASLSWIGDSTY
jgi:hypothetical protein